MSFVCSSPCSQHKKAFDPASVAFGSFRHSHPTTTSKKYPAINAGTFLMAEGEGFGHRFAFANASVDPGSASVTPAPFDSYFTHQ